MVFVSITDTDFDNIIDLSDGSWSRLSIRGISIIFSMLTSDESAYYKIDYGLHNEEFSGITKTWIMQLQAGQFNHHVVNRWILYYK